MNIKVMRFPLKHVGMTDVDVFLLTFISPVKSKQ